MKRAENLEKCPCGSGENESICCGKTNVMILNFDIYNDELESLHTELLAFAFDHFEDQFIEQVEIHYDPLLDEKEAISEAYLTGITLWTILNIPIFKNGQTIFDSYYAQQKSLAKWTRVRNTLAEWAYTAPSVYEIKTIDYDKEMIIIQELLTNEYFNIPYDKEDQLTKGNLIIGCLIPFVGYHRFFFNMMEVYQHSKPILLQLLRKYAEGENKLRDTFPEFLIGVLSLNDSTMDWEQPIHKEVAELFKTKMVDKGYDEETISLGILIWHQYCEKQGPSFKKAAPYAAAIEYLVHLFIIENEQVTQTQLALEYDTSARMISKNFRRVLTAVENGLLADFLEDGEDLFLGK